MKYRIGNYVDPEPDDPYFATEQAAIEAAKEMHKRDENEPIAVWSVSPKLCEVLWLILRNVTFRPE